MNQNNRLWTESLLDTFPQLETQKKKKKKANEI